MRNCRTPSLHNYGYFDLACDNYIAKLSYLLIVVVLFPCVQTEKMNAQEDYLSARQCSRLTRVTLLCFVLIPITMVTIAVIAIGVVS